MATSRVIPDGTENNLAAGHTPVTKADDATLTVAEVSNVLVSVSAAKKMTLPSMTPGLACIIYSTGANIVTVDPSGDEILEGDDLSSNPGGAMNSLGEVGQYARLLCAVAGISTMIDWEGTWESEGV